MFCRVLSKKKFFFVKFSSSHWLMMSFIKMKTALYDAKLQGLCRALFFSALLNNDHLFNQPIIS